MFGVMRSATSDFSAFSYPRPSTSSTICYETHDTSIEERYCAKSHVRTCDDREWEDLLARSVKIFDDNEAEKRPSLRLHLPYEEEEAKYAENRFEEETWNMLPECPPTTPVSALSTPSLVGGACQEDCQFSHDGNSDNESEYDFEKVGKKDLAAILASTSSNKRKRTTRTTPFNPRKRLVRSNSTTSVSTITSVASASSNTSNSTAIILQAMMDSDNPWKCPHCPWVQHTQRLPDFLRHQRSHFVTLSDWPCPNPKCGKGFARKDSLKRHLDNKATGCKRPPGYTVC